jgi:hypothetical protein
MCRGLTKRTGTGTAQFLHVRPCAKDEPHVVAERAYVRTGIAVHPEQDEPVFETEDLYPVNFADAEVAFHGALFRGTLVNSPGELMRYLFDPALFHIHVHPHQADIFLFVLQEKRCEAHGISQHDEEHTGYLRVKGSCMSHLAPEHLPHPGCDLVARWSAGLVDNKDARAMPELS